MVAKQPSRGGGREPGCRDSRPSLVRLPAQEGRNVELVFLAAVMHRRLPTVLIEPLRRLTLGIFGHRFGPRRRTPGKPFSRRRRQRRRAARARRYFLLLVAAAETDGRQALQERHPPFLGMLLRQLAAAGAKLVLRGHRQLVDPRHAHPARRHAFRLRRNERLRLVRLRSARRRIHKQGRLQAERSDGHILAGALRKNRRGDGSLGGFDRIVDRSGGRNRRGGGLPNRLGPLAALRVTFVVGTQPVRNFGNARFRSGGLPLGECVIDSGRDNGNADDAVEALVKGGADDDIRILIDLFADAGCRLVDLVEGCLLYTSRCV